MSPFKALYKKSCNTPISWSDPITKVLIGLDMLVYMEHEIQVINKNRKVTQGKKKIYVDHNKMFKEF